MKSRRFRKRSVRRKRAFRRSYRKRYSGPKPDGAVCARISAISNVVHSTAAGHADTTVNWAGNTAAAVPTQNLRVTVTSEFTNFSSRYTEYRVIGVKMTYLPMQYQSASDVGFYSIWYGSDTKSLPQSATADNQFSSLCDYKILPGNRMFSRYINLRKYFAKRNTNWVNTAVNYPDAGSCFRVYSFGFADGVKVGTVRAVWYVQFKGLRL